MDGYLDALVFFFFFFSYAKFAKFNNIEEEGREEEGALKLRTLIINLIINA